ncbi:unnamed protein product, partial [Nesidiocoris tenuis]
RGTKIKATTQLFRRRLLFSYRGGPTSSARPCRRLTCPALVSPSPIRPPRLNQYLLQIHQARKSDKVRRRNFPYQLVRHWPPKVAPPYPMSRFPNSKIPRWKICSVRGNTARRTVRFGMRSPGNSSRGVGSGRSSGPTPIVWTSPEHPQSGQQSSGQGQAISMVPLTHPMRDYSGRMRGVGSSRPERPPPGFRGRVRRPRMSPYHPGNFGPRF